jgi:hypothetical protein
VLATPGTGVSTAELARTTRFTKPNVAFAVDALVLAGLLDTRTVGNERRVSLPTGAAVLPNLRGPVPQTDWVARFGIALAVLRFTEHDGMPPAVRAIEARRVVEVLRDRLTSEGAPRPNLDVLGVDFAQAFDRWLASLVDWIRSPLPR